MFEEPAYLSFGILFDFISEGFTSSIKVVFILEYYEAYEK